MSTKLGEQRVRGVERGLGRACVFSAVALLVIVTAWPASLLAQKTEKTGRAVISTVKPEYPVALQHAQIGGLVRLSATVLPNGTVSKVQIRGGNPILAECAAAAVMKWKYAPAPTETNEEVFLSFSPH
jgi:TonB family protein